MLKIFLQKASMTFSILPTRVVLEKPSYFESLSFVVIFSLPPLNHSGYFFLQSGLTHLKICFSWFFCLFFRCYVGSSLALSVWEFTLSTSVNVSHTLALSIIFFSLLLKLPQFTYQIPFFSLPFLLFPLLLLFATFWEMCIILPSNSFDFLYHWPY